ncbi:MAG: beta-galactosidase trimerization domain-containing protein [bacterium]|nr:beta-galactosidase trimerization domain-containing protein [bacterium]
MCKRMVFCLLLGLIVVWNSYGQKQETKIQYNILRSSDTGGAFIFCVLADPAKKKLYAGTYSYDPERKGLWVYDLNPDGTVAGKPRRYTDHPDPMPDPLPPGGWSSVTALYLDRKYNKLFLGVSVAGVKGFENFSKSLVMYNLDQNGEPTGKPLAFDSGNPNKHIAAITKHPRLNKLYIVGWGGDGVYVTDLDANGIPASKPTTYSVPGHGKYSINFNSDGTKVYLGTYPSVLQVCDVDANGGISNPRSYSVANGPQEYMLCVATEKAVFFKGPNNNLSYFLLDRSGEVQGSPIVVDNFPVQAIGLSDISDRVIVASSTGFNDVINGNFVIEGLSLKEIEITPDGKSIKVTRETEKLLREKAQCISGTPSITLATSHLGWGFLGNKISGVEMKVTLKAIESETPLPPAFKTIKIGSEQKYLKFVYSSRFNKLYASGDNNIYVYQPGWGEKVVSVPCSELQGPLAIDETSGILYAARKDGTIAIRKIDNTGIPASEGENLQSGVRPVKLLAFNLHAKILYVIGSIQKEEPQSQIFCRVPSFTYDIAAIVDSVKGKLYVASQYNKNENLTVWDLDKNGKLVSETPKRYFDGFTSENKRTCLYGMALNVKKSKLYLCGMLENPQKDEAGIMVYDLDANGNPVGTPKFFPTRSKTNSPWDIQISSDGQKLYEVGWGIPAVFEWALDKDGFLTGEPAVWETAGHGKSQIQIVPESNVILLGTYPMILETVPIDRNGKPLGGVSITIAADKGTINAGFLTPGVSSDWINLDTQLRDGTGLAGIICGLTGATVKKADIQFDFRKATGSKIENLKSFNIITAGNSISLFVPKYGLDEPEKLTSMIQSSIDKFKEYLSFAKKYALKPEERPKEIIIANGLISLDGTPETLEDGLNILSMLGHNTIQIWHWGNIKPEDIRKKAAQYGFNRFRGAVYNPPSYFDYNTSMVTNEYLDNWLAEIKKSFSNMGQKNEEMVLFHIADEPGWYYPHQIDDVKKDISRLKVFRDYLKSKGFTPQTFGKKSWEEIEPMKLSEPITLADKRLFFWTTRFFTESLSKAFAAATRAFQRAYNQNILTTTNLNNWPGYFFRPSPGVKIANNWDAGPDAGMGLPDWFDLGRKRAVSCIWTEDWFGDSSAQNWSMYGDLLRCAAREGGIEYGGYIVGHTTGSIVPDGGKYKIMALIGHGAKAIDPYIFGPGLAFADGWSEREQVYQSLAEGIKLVGKSEELIAPGRPKDGTVAILLPQASQVWDKDSTMKSYMWELYGLHEALIHENYPVDFIDDFDIEDGILKKITYSVLYVTAPNLSAKAQKNILEWVRDGGTIVMMPGACAADEYDEPLTVLTGITGIKQPSVERMPQTHPYDIDKLKKKKIIVKDTRFEVEEFYTKFQVVPLSPTTAKTLAVFEDGSPVLVETPYNKGRIFYYGFWPGITYHLTADRSDYRKLPEGWSEPARKMVTMPAKIAGTPKYVEISESLIEGCYLKSEKGIAITLLNWSGEPKKEITVTINDAGNTRKVTSIENGTLNWEKSDNKIQVKLPLKTVDVLMLYF